MAYAAAPTLDDATLQNLALENNLSETAFTVKVGRGADADYELRWFTPLREVALCGHATLASGHVLIGERPVIRFRTRKAGILEVRRDEEGGVWNRLKADCALNIKGKNYSFVLDPGPSGATRHDGAEWSR